MAETKLIFNEETLDQESGIYKLYIRLYEGMRTANECTPPDYTTNPPLTEDGEIDIAAMNEGLSAYSTILMKNSAYLYASSIIGVVGEGGGGSGGAGGNYLLRTGDSMEGPLNALYGITGGYEGNVVFEASINASEEPILLVYGDIVARNKRITANSIDIADEGIYFNGTQVIYIDEEGILNLDADSIKFGAPVKFDQIQIGDLLITELGITWGEYDFYHGGNCNNADTDWSMRDAYVYGDLNVEGGISIAGLFQALNGFALGADGVAILYSNKLEGDEHAHIVVDSDINLTLTHSFQVGHAKVLFARNGENDIISLSAPGRVLNLGDSDGDIFTKYISLQADVYNAAGNKMIVSMYGDGNFYGSLKAGCGASSTAFETYLNTEEDYGVMFLKNIRFGDAHGPAISSDGGIHKELLMRLPYDYVDENNLARSALLPVGFKMEYTTSLYKDLSKDWSASLHVRSDAEFVVFDNPVEAKRFAIDSEIYKTCLIENALFFNDGIFIEGLADGMLANGNFYFSDSLSSRAFASGFAGYGWAISENRTYGGFAATFDELTVRKKMRVYELEVQKMSVTNGSLWVSDSCSGDIVEEIV